MRLRADIKRASSDIRHLQDGGMAVRYSRFMRILLFSFLLAGCGTQDAEEAPAKDAADKSVADGAPEKVSYAPPPDVAAPPTDALSTESGLAYKVLEPAPAARCFMLPFRNPDVRRELAPAEIRLREKEMVPARPPTAAGTKV